MRSSSIADSSSARKRPVNLTLDAALINQVKSIANNLSATVESLLGLYVDEHHRGQRDAVAKASKCAAQWNAVNEALGSFADEYSTL